MKGRADWTVDFYKQRKEEAHSRLKNCPLFQNLISFIKWRKKRILN